MSTIAKRSSFSTVSRLIARQCLRAFIFDVDGVLADTAELHVDAWRRAVFEEGIEFPESIADCLRGASRRRSLELILGDRLIAPSQFEAIMDRKNVLYVNSLSRLSVDDRLPGSFEVISWLRESRIKVSAVSASCNARQVLESIDALIWFDVIVDGNAERQGGGDHRFLLAAAGLKEKPTSCCVVEDSIANIQHARRLGMTTLGVGPASVSDLPDIAARSLLELDADSHLNRRIV